MNKVIILVLLLMVLPVAYAEVQRVDVPLTVKVTNQTCTIIKQDDNAQYPYNTGQGIDTSHSLTLTTYKNYTNVCPDSDSIKSICDSTLKNISSAMSIIASNNGKPDYFPQYTDCVKSLSQEQTEKSNIKTQYGDYNSIKSLKEVCENVALPNCKSELNAKTSELNTAQATSNAQQQRIKDIEQQRWIFLLVGALVGAGGMYWSKVKSKTKPEQTHGSSTPMIPGEGQM